MTTRAEIEIEQAGDVVVARLIAKRFDSASFETLTRRIYRLIDHDHCRKIVLNLSHIEFLFSESVGLLVGLEKRVKHSECELRLCNLRPNVRETLEITQLQELFEIYDDEPSALLGF